jgi:hypothetical protein
MCFKGMRVCKLALTIENSAKAKDNYKNKDKKPEGVASLTRRSCPRIKARKQLMLVIP